MSFTELVIIAIGLSMDAFAVSVCKGLSVTRVKPKHMAAAGLYFGGFQGLMPLIGFLLGVNFRSLIERFDHWIAFVLLGLIGISMLREAFDAEEDCCCDDSHSDFSFRAMLPLAVATSIDALAVGVTFAFLSVDIVPAVLLIGCITFVLSALGIKIGNVFGAKYRAKAEIAGGIILILMGTKILLEHLGILIF